MWEKLFSCMINQRLLVQDIALVVCMNKYLYIYIHDIYLKRFIDTMYVKVCVLLCLCLSLCVCVCIISKFIYIFFLFFWILLYYVYIYLFIRSWGFCVNWIKNRHKWCVFSLVNPYPFPPTPAHRLTRRACGYNLGGFGSPWPSPRETCEATPTAYAVYPPAGYSLFPKREQKARIEKKM